MPANDYWSKVRAAKKVVREAGAAIMRAERQIRDIQDKCAQLGGHAWGQDEHNVADDVWTRTCQSCDFTDETDQFETLERRIPIWD